MVCNVFKAHSYSHVHVCVQIKTTSTSAIEIIWRLMKKQLPHRRSRRRPILGREKEKKERMFTTLWKKKNRKEDTNGKTLSVRKKQGKEKKLATNPMHSEQAGRNRTQAREHHFEPYLILKRKLRNLCILAEGMMGEFCVSCWYVYVRAMA